MKILVVHDTILVNVVGEKGFADADLVIAPIEGYEGAGGEWMILKNRNGLSSIVISCTVLNLIMRGENS